MSETVMGRAFAAGIAQLSVSPSGGGTAMNPQFAYTGHARAFGPGHVPVNGLGPTPEAAMVNAVNSWIEKYAPTHPVRKRVRPRTRPRP